MYIKLSLRIVQAFILLMIALIAAPFCEAASVQRGEAHVKPVGVLLSHGTGPSAVPHLHTTGIWADMAVVRLENVMPGELLDINTEAEGFTYSGKTRIATRVVARDMAGAATMIRNTGAAIIDDFQQALLSRAVAFIVPPGLAGPVDIVLQVKINQIGTPPTTAFASYVFFVPHQQFIEVFRQ